MSSRVRRGMGATNGPKSWADDCNTYRATRGAQAFAAVEPENTTKRFSRTTLAQFADVRHPYFSTGGHPDHKNTAEDSSRFERHGWGNTTLLKEDKQYPSRTHEPSYGRQKVAGAAGPGVGSNRPANRHATDRSDLFGTLQQTDVGAPPGKDSWLGHSLIDPARGKANPKPPPDPKGRKDLFDVVNYRNPGVPSDDSWMGHKDIDPQRGKGPTLTPGERIGRMTLNDVMEQTIMSDVKREALLGKGVDPLGDAWIGNQLIDPRVGKQPTQSRSADALVNSGCEVGAHAEAPWVRHRFQPENAIRGGTAVVKDIINGVAPPDWTPREEWGARTRRERPAFNYEGRGDVAATLKPVPRAATDSGKPWQWDDSRVERRRVNPVKPGDGHPACGPEMLHWKPEEKLGQFVQYGNKAQVRNNFTNGRAKDPIVW
mmetsp:Transcript_4492/g.11180  ORF Transcript_4492/g.11180 Transcript_4492/m.11180 type:complete len:429 (+) Transcript_4492:159-1445(+)